MPQLRKTDMLGKVRWVSCTLHIRAERDILKSAPLTTCFVFVDYFPSLLTHVICLLNVSASLLIVSNIFRPNVFIGVFALRST